MKKAFLISALIMFASLLSFEEALAQDAGDWIRSGDILASELDNSQAAIHGQSDCVTQEVSIAYGVNFITRSLCIYQSKYLRYALYQRPTAWWEPINYKMVIAYPGDKQMYEVEDDGSEFSYGSGISFHLPGRDDFVFRKSNGSLLLAKNASRHLVPIKDQASGKLIAYKLNNLSYLLKGVTVASQYAASRNGRWVVVYGSGQYVWRIDMDDYSAKRITDKLDAFNPSPLFGNFAVSNDGQYIAAMGSDVESYVYKVTDECGVKSAIDAVIFLSPVNLQKQPCAKRSLESVLGQKYEIYNGKFDSSGSELIVERRRYTEDVPESSWISLTLPGYERHLLDYLALGDSYSSGEGEDSDEYYQPFTNTEHEKCHQSRRSYPYLIAQHLKLDQGRFKSVACGGAKMIDILDYREYKGQGDRLAQYSDQDMARLQRESLISGIPGRLLQNVFVQTYSPKVATISIGGNDNGLLDKVRPCLGLDECEWASSSRRAQLAQEIRGIFGQLVKTYQGIKATSPSIKLYVIGYPAIIHPTNECEAPLHRLLTANEQRLIFESIRYLNQVIAAAAYKAGVKYIDAENSFDDKTLCGSSDVRAMNAIRLGDDSSPISWLPGLAVIGNESLHPNPLGNALMAEAIKNAVPNLQTFDVCASQSSCTHDEVVAPEPPSYWQADSNGQQPELRSKQFALPAQTGNSSPITLGFDPFDFQPGSSVGLEVHSNPLSLGNLSTAADGSLQSTIRLPAGLEPGYHTLHATGVSVGGDPIEYYQVILVMKDGRVLTLSQEANEAKVMHAKAGTLQTPFATAPEEKHKVESPDPRQEPAPATDSNMTQFLFNTDMLPPFIASGLTRIGAMLSIQPGRYALSENVLLFAIVILGAGTGLAYIVKRRIKK